MTGRIYLVCGCGFFYGDVRLYPEVTVNCEKCGADEAQAFRTLEEALKASYRKAKSNVLDEVQPR